jgi:hypothetical protein
MYVQTCVCMHAHPSVKHAFTHMRYPSTLSLPHTHTSRKLEKEKKSLAISKCKYYGVLYKELCFKNVRCICNGCHVSQHVISHHGTQHSVTTGKWSSFGRWKKWVNEVSRHRHLESAQAKATMLGWSEYCQDSFIDSLCLSCSSEEDNRIQQKYEQGLTSRIFYVALVTVAMYTVKSSNRRSGCLHASCLPQASLRSWVSFLRLLKV